MQRVLGVNVLPARVMRPTDKQTVERAFGAARSLLFERLLGYQGVDVADRGVDPEADAVLTIDAMENLIATWILRVWQNRRLGEYGPSWHPGGKHNPNTLFAAAMAQGGFSLQVPPPQLYYQLLPAHHVKIHPQRGVKIRGLWYDGPALDDYRGHPSARGGTRKGLWVIRRDPRDRRFVYFQDPENTDVWHTLRWVGLPPTGQVPSFGDARVHDMLAAAKNAGLTPKSDEELLPVLLDLLGGYTPCSSGRRNCPSSSAPATPARSRKPRPPPPTAPASHARTTPTPSLSTALRYCAGTSGPGMRSRLWTMNADNDASEASTKPRHRHQGWVTTCADAACSC